MVDVKVQGDIILHPYFVPWINKKYTLQVIEDIFSATQKRDMLKKMEPIRPVHKPWIELTEDDGIQWKPRGEDSYSGSQGGGPAGPSFAMKEVARTVELLAAIFFSFCL